MLPASIEIREMIREAAKNGMAIAELEYLGVSVRTISVLESSKYLYLEDLLKISDQDFIAIKSLGKHGHQELTKAFRRFSELETSRKEWHASSERIEFYKQRIPKHSYTLR